MKLESIQKNLKKDLTRILNTSKYLIKHGGYSVFVDKLVSRFYRRQPSIPASALTIARLSIEDWCRSIDNQLFEESHDFYSSARKLSISVTNGSDLKESGAGAYQLLYFLTKLIQPACVLETGVAFGLSSYAFLRGMSENGFGHLYSSDLPYFRLSDQDIIVGKAVPGDLKDRWSLYLGGDLVNLPKILSDTDVTFDVIHYDSDKSYRGKKRSLGLLLPRLSKDGLLIVDDIHNDNFFYELQSQAIFSYAVTFTFEGKLLGLMTNNPRFSSSLDFVSSSEL